MCTIALLWRVAETDVGADVSNTAGHWSEHHEPRWQTQARSTPPGFLHRRDRSVSQVCHHES